MRNLALLKIPVASALERKAVAVQEKLSVLNPELAEPEAGVVSVEW
jgi:hypothetical protein